MILEGTGTAEEIAANYLAFDFVVKYATKYGYTGDFASGWYMPRITGMLFY